MVELGELESRHRDFEERNVRVVAISNDDVETAQATQADLPHLVVVSDQGHGMAKALAVVQPGGGPSGGDTNVPTTFIIDGDGTVRWVRRPERFLVRLAPEEILAAIDEAGVGE